MIHGFSGNARVFIALGATDMRKSINGLSLLVEEQFELDLLPEAILLSATESEPSSRSSTGLIMAFVSG